MCGRYRLKRGDARELALLLGVPELEITLADPDQQRWNIAPQEKTPPPIIYRAQPGGSLRVTDSVPWGILLPDRLLINAKQESAKTHSRNLTERRCLVPASGYYEWLTHAQEHSGRPSKLRKTPFLLRLANDASFTFAGIWGSNFKPSPLGPAGFVIMTGEPGKEIAFAHNRMPLVVPEEARNQWMSPEMSFADAQALLRDVIVPFSQDAPWVVHPITPLPSGRGANEIPEPYLLPWWQPSMGQVLAGIHNWRGERPVQAEDLQTSTGLPLNELESDL